MNIQEFTAQLQEIVCKEYENLTTEEYLRRLLAQMQQYQNVPPTSQLLLQIFEEALITEPLAFDENWNKLKEPDFYEEEVAGNKDEFAYTLEVIQFFVADLKRMKNKELKDPNRGNGVTSPSGASWYNFTICEFASAFARFDEDAHEDDEHLDIDIADMSWDLIADILIIGKSYE